MLPFPPTHATRTVASTRLLANLLLVLMLALTLSGCKEVTTSDIEIRKGVAYIKNKTEPYSGPIKGYFKKTDGTNGKLMLEGTYSNGLKFDVWTTYGWNGEKSVVKYEAGLEEGLAEEFYLDGSLKRTIAYSKGKRNGFTSDYAPDGQVSRQLYYRKGLAGRLPSAKKSEGKGGESEEMDPNEIEEKLYGKRQKSMLEYIIEWF
ncbi:MAG: hypothetical protein HW380_2838 [Magnetococcales bacterium]|nr:hypothetical protein [Magnetococcales bacterium]HIJ83693.1 hypothetical protein [Magnetococcales bacterium]